MREREKESERERERERERECVCVRERERERERERPALAAANGEPPAIEHMDGDDAEEGMRSAVVTSPPGTEINWEKERGREEGGRERVERGKRERGREGEKRVRNKKSHFITFLLSLSYTHTQYPQKNTRLLAHTQHTHTHTRPHAPRRRTALRCGE